MHENGDRILTDQSSLETFGKRRFGQLKTLTKGFRLALHHLQYIPFTEPHVQWQFWILTWQLIFNSDLCYTCIQPHTVLHLFFKLSISQVSWMDQRSPSSLCGMAHSLSTFYVFKLILLSFNSQVKRRQRLSTCPNIYFLRLHF